jgi:hypothetical protein
VDKLLKNYPVKEYRGAREAMEKGDVIKGVLIW